MRNSLPHYPSTHPSRPQHMIWCGLALSLTTAITLLCGGCIVRHQYGVRISRVRHTVLHRVRMILPHLKVGLLRSVYHMWLWLWLRAVESRLWCYDRWRGSRHCRQRLCADLGRGSKLHPQGVDLRWNDTLFIQVLNG